MENPSNHNCVYTHHRSFLVVSLAKVNVFIATACVSIYSVKFDQRRASFLPMQVSLPIFTGIHSLQVFLISDQSDHYFAELLPVIIACHYCMTLACYQRLEQPQHHSSISIPRLYCRLYYIKFQSVFK